MVIIGCVYIAVRTLPLAIIGVINLLTLASRLRGFSAGNASSYLPHLPMRPRTFVSSVENWNSLVENEAGSATETFSESHTDREKRRYGWTADY